MGSSNCCKTPERCATETELNCVKEGLNALDVRVGAVEGGLAKVVAKQTPGRIAIGFVGNTGISSPEQVAVQNSLVALNDEVVLLGNQVSSGSTDLATNLATLDGLRTAGKLHACLGFDDYDNLPGGVSEHTTYFGGPGNGRYYGVEYTEQSLLVVVVASGVDSAGALQEADGNTVGSVQYNAVKAMIEGSEMRWKVVCFCNPFATVMAVPPTNLVQTDLDWDWAALGASLVLTGGARMNARILKNAGIDVLECGNGSGSGNGTPNVNWTLTGAALNSATLFADDLNAGASFNGVVRIVTCSTGLRVELWDHTGLSGAGSLPLLHQFVIV